MKEADKKIIRKKLNLTKEDEKLVAKNLLIAWAMISICLGVTSFAITYFNLKSAEPNASYLKTFLIWVLATISIPTAVIGISYSFYYFPKFFKASIK